MLTERRAAGMVAGVAVLWGSVGVVVRHVELPAVALVTARIWIAAPALSIFVRRRRADLPWVWRPSGLLLLLFSASVAPEVVAEAESLSVHFISKVDHDGLVKQLKVLHAVVSEG